MNVNPLRGEVTVAGTDIVLVFDVNAFVLAEMALGKTTDAIVTDFEAMRSATVKGERGSVDLTLLRALFWAGLQRHDDCTIDEAADRMPVQISAVQDAVAAGMLAAFGAAEDKDGPRPPKKVKPSTG